MNSQDLTYTENYSRKVLSEMKEADIWCTYFVDNKK